MSEIAELSAAMARAFGAIEGAIKGKANPAFRSRYADLAAVVDAIKPALAEHGLWFRQVTHPADGGVCVETVIHHASGQSIGCGPLFVPAMKQDPQGFGAALTYARRYSLMTAFGVPAEDDDGNAASGRHAPAQQRPAAPPPADPEVSAADHAKWIAGMVTSMREAALAKDRTTVERIRDAAKARCSAIGDADGYQAVLDAMKHPQGAPA